MTNIMIVGKLWICYIRKPFPRYCRRWIPRGIGYIDDKPSLYWCLLWKIQLMWFTKRRNNKVFKILKKG